MESSAEISHEPKLKPVPFDRDEKVVEKILTPEYLNQPGAKIAMKFLDILGLPYGQCSSFDPENPSTKEKSSNEQILAEELTNKSGTAYDTVYEENNISFISRDPRHFLENLDPKLKASMPPKLANIFQNEFAHHKAKKDDGGVMPFAYLRLPGGIDVILKGYTHTASWQKEHGEYLANTAKEAGIVCIEGWEDKKFGDSLKYNWEESDKGDYDTLMREAVGYGFGGVFSEIDMRDTSEIYVDHKEDPDSPDLPDEFFQNYYKYLDKFFHEDAAKIGNSENLKEILKKLSTTPSNISTNELFTNIQGIGTYSHAYVDKNFEIQREMTGLEYGQRFFSDAMAALKLLQIAKEMEDGRMEKDIIVDFEGDLHLQAKYFFLRNPFLAMMTVLKNPHFILMEKLAKKDDVSSIYPAFSPDKEMFADMFKQIWRLEFARPEKEGDRTGIEPGPKQMPMKKFEIPGRKEALEAVMKKFTAEPLPLPV